MPVVRWDVDPTATVRLRFDDPEWIEALALQEDSDETSLYHKLRAALRAQPASVDVSGLVADGVWLDVRRSITGPEDDRIAVAAQMVERKGWKYDAEAAATMLLATWITGVGDEAGGVPDWLARGSSTPTPKLRADAWKKCPAHLRALITARLRVHEHVAMAPVVVDPNWSTDRDTGKGSRSTTTTSTGAPASVPTRSD